MDITLMFSAAAVVAVELVASYVTQRSMSDVFSSKSLLGVYCKRNAYSSGQPHKEESAQ
jgi:hypothetical protein